MNDTPLTADSAQILVNVSQHAVNLMGMGFIAGGLTAILILVLLDYARLRKVKS